jgi:hypothetical protein
MAYFTQFLRCQKNLILKILRVFLRLNSSSALNLNKLSHLQTASKKPTYLASMRSFHFETMNKPIGTGCLNKSGPLDHLTHR